MTYIHPFVVPIYPHDTDYGGIVSHRAVVTWLEMARINYVRSAGLEFAKLWQSGFDIPVVRLNVHFHKKIGFGTAVLIKTELVEFSAPRLSWAYRIYSTDEDIFHAEGRSDHAIVDVQRNKPSRRFPEDMERQLRPLLKQETPTGH
jgi:acyl-CoA thioester hydrolase